MPYRLLLALTSIVACVAHGADEPQWLKEAREREGKAIKVATIKSADGFFTTKLPAKQIGKIEQEGDGYTITLDLGSDTPMTCEVIKDGFDLAAILRTVATNTLTEVQSVHGEIEVKGVERQDAGVIGASPFMSVDWIYRANDGKGARLGALKQFAALKGEHGLYCAHVELGYRATFKNVATAFVESIEFAESAPLPHYYEISTASIGDSRIGIAILSLDRNDGGDLRLVTSSSLLVPLTLDTQTAQDAYHVQWADKDAAMQEATHVVSTNGKIETKLTLRPGDAGEWIVEGMFKEKDIKESIASAAPSTWLGQARARRALFGQADIVGKSLSEQLWVTASPTSFVDSKFTVAAIVDDRRIAGHETAANLAMDVVLEKATGMAVRGVIHIGPQTITLERVLQLGEL